MRATHELIFLLHLHVSADCARMAGLCAEGGSADEPRRYSVHDALDGRSFTSRGF
jgi:hypothetical protein